jgi:fermentation-respiration switch protein FrsA (DUF1100 family)
MEPGKGSGELLEIIRQYRKIPEYVTVIAVVFIHSSCSFNKMFLKPDRADPSAGSYIFFSPADTTKITFEGLLHQPVFRRMNGSEVPLGYTIESVVFKSATGNQLNGWMMTPKNVVPDITLFHLHGNSGWILTQSLIMLPLVKQGFRVFSFDYSGFGFSEGEATRDNVLADALSAFDYLTSRPEVQGNKVIVYGQSLGGHLSAVVAEKKQAQLDGLVVEGAFSSHDDIAGSRFPLIGPFMVKEKYVAKKAIRDFHKPLLVVHSREDKVIPFRLGEKIFKAANEPKSFLEIKGCHICGPRLYTEEIAARIRQLVNK